MNTIAEFTQKLHDDPELLARVEAAEPGERHALLEANGIEVSPELQEQAKAAVQRLGIDPTDPSSWAAVELSDDELTQLAGGMSKLSQIGLSAGVTAGGGAISAAATVTLCVILG